MLSKNNVIMAIACAIGVTAGGLTYLTSRSCSQALLAAGAAVSGSSDLIRYLLAADPEHPATDRADEADLRPRWRPSGGVIR